VRKLVVLTVAVLTLTATGQALGKAPQGNKWIAGWTKADSSIYPSINKASKLFGVDPSLMKTIVGREGGNISPATLARSLCNGYGVGWNLQGSAAFGPFQFMLDYRGACYNQWDWGTFGSYDDAAFQAAKQLGTPIPYRFKSPASNLGQAITAAYMLANGGLSHWCASMC
jgi:hypothetical protein